MSTETVTLTVSEEFLTRILQRTQQAQAIAEKFRESVRTGNTISLREIMALTSSIITFNEDNA